MGTPEISDTERFDNIDADFKYASSCGDVKEVICKINGKYYKRIYYKKYIET